ncbi:hypothetical protein ABD91_00860 [Lysinibacillus sphaericus]|uniref:hypothetical protein n=1 Tax=Lysinibacillus sphaericus TaxID=1421 RepID=UPI0018CD99CB|nr:hypothetical protein [Lysinibacillus sphaericus]MBG9689477.1 hypothetical protein [Lysinibacillus sphaericus]
MKLKDIKYELLTEKEKSVIDFVNVHRYHELIYTEELLKLIHAKYEVREKINGTSSNKYYGYICLYDNNAVIATLEFENLTIDEDIKKYKYKNISRIMLTHHWKTEVHYALYELLTNLLPNNTRLKNLRSIFNK